MQNTNIDQLLSQLNTLSSQFQGCNDNLQMMQKKTDEFNQLLRQLYNLQNSIKEKSLIKKIEKLIQNNEEILKNMKNKIGSEQDPKKQPISVQEEQQEQNRLISKAATIIRLKEVDKAEAQSQNDSIIYNETAEDTYKTLLIKYSQIHNNFYSYLAKQKKSERNELTLNIKDFQTSICFDSLNVLEEYAASFANSNQFRFLQRGKKLKFLLFLGIFFDINKQTFYLDEPKVHRLRNYRFNNDDPSFKQFGNSLHVMRQLLIELLKLKQLKKSQLNKLSLSVEKNGKYFTNYKIFQQYTEANSTEQSRETSLTLKLNNSQGVQNWSVAKTLLVLGAFYRRASHIKQKNEDQYSQDVTRQQKIDKIFPKGLIRQPIQDEYMLKVLETLENNQSILIQSPTGTGKTLCLLISSLVWLEDFRTKHPEKDVQIVYASRTHSQLEQTVAELRKTPFMPRVQVLGSREHLCVNSKVRDHAIQNGMSLSAACKLACNNSNSGQDHQLLQDLFIQVSQNFFRNPDITLNLIEKFNKALICYKKDNQNYQQTFQMLEKIYQDTKLPYSKVYYARKLKFSKKIIDKLKLKESLHCNKKDKVGKLSEREKDLLPPIADIEDLKTFGTQTDSCPYYASHAKKHQQDILLCPYQYLLDSKGIRKFFNYTFSQQSDRIDQERLNQMNQNKVTVVIFDEGHNVSEAQTSGQVATISIKQVQRAQQIIDKVANICQDILFNENQQLQECQNFLCQIQNSDEQYNLINAEINSSQQQIKFQEKILPITRSLLDFLRDMYKAMNYDRSKFVNSQKGTERFFRQTSCQLGVSEDEIIRDLFLYPQNRLKIKDTIKQLEEIVKLCQQRDLQSIDYSSVFDANELFTVRDFLEQVLHVLSLTKLSGPKYSQLKNSYKLLLNIDEKILEMDKINPSDEQQLNAEFEFYCLDFTEQFRRLISFPGTFNFIVTSATLKPFSMWQRELSRLKMPFVYHAISNHFIDAKKQFFSAHLNICPKFSREDYLCKKSKESNTNSDQSVSANRVRYYDFRYEVRQTNHVVERMIWNIGELLLDLLTSLKEGVVLIFASRSLFNLFQQFWNGEGSKKCNSYYWAEIKKKRSVFVEGLTFEETSKIKKDYDRVCLDGAVYCAMARGRSVEGIDFSDEQSRAVFLIGVPNLNTQEPRIKLVMEYYDKLKELEKDNEVQRKMMSGKKWLRHSTIQCINQSIGRAIRHPKDYGCVFFIDDRFQDYKDKVPEWARQNVYPYTDIKVLKSALQDFYASNQSRNRQKIAAVQRQQDDEDDSFM